MFLLSSPSMTFTIPLRRSPENWCRPSSFRCAPESDSRGSKPQKWAISSQQSPSPRPPPLFSLLPHTPCLSLPASEAGDIAHGRYSVKTLDITAKLMTPENLEVQGSRRRKSFSVPHSPFPWQRSLKQKKRVGYQGLHRLA